MPFKVRTLEGKKWKLRPEIQKSLLDLNSKAQKTVGNVALSNYNTDISSSIANLLNEFNYNKTYIEEPQANSTRTSQVSLDNITSQVEDSVKFDINKILENQKSILDNQATILSQIFESQQQQQESATAIIAQIQSLNKMQNDLIQKVSALSVQLKNAVSQIIRSSSQDHVLTLNESQCLIENTPILVKPVDSVQDLDELEKQLSDANNRAHLKNTYSILCSEGKGINCAYLLVDVMFTRKFLFECSWSGGSRGENSKVPLKVYKHVLSFFWQMVHSGDGTYTLQDNEAFFKTILRNAKSRKMAKLERASKSRQNSKSIKNSKRISCQENAILPTENEACNDFESGDETYKEEDMEENKEKNESQGENTEDQKSILDNQATILSQIFQSQQQQRESATAIIAQIQSLNKMQHGLIQKVSALSVQLKNAASQIISSSSQDYVPPPLNESQSLIENTPINFKPVDSVHDLDELEKQLSDANNRAHLKNTFSVLCSEGKALDCAYLLVDVMFTRNFLFECSWSGGSRGENLKIPLKGYKHVLSFFWQMVHSWDDAYTLQDNEAFFKTILKNSKKRKMAKLERASTSRQKSKSIKNSKRIKSCHENATLPTEKEAGNDYESENETWYK